MHIESARTTGVPAQDPVLGTLPLALIIIEMSDMDGDVTVLQEALAELKNEVGKTAINDGCDEGSMTVSVTVLDGSKIVLMGMYRNPGVAYDEACAILAKHGVDVTSAPKLSGNPYGDDRYQPGTRDALPLRVKTTVAAPAE